MPPVFAHVPALAIKGLLDYNQSEHVKIYRSGIKSVRKNRFDCKAEGLYQLLMDVRNHADRIG
jgi:hypothetical protein